MLSLSPLFSKNNLKFVVVGDVHINTSRFYDFEVKRIDYLAYKIAQQKPDVVILNGDILDKSKPTLQDIELFYTLIDNIKCEYIILIAGNHEVLSADKTCYDYLPQVNYIYVDVAKLKVNDTTFLLVSNHKLQEIKKHKANYLFSHYRTAVNDFMTDEFDNKYVSESFKFTILSDIHMDFQPYFNIMYTSSPNSLKFEEKRGVEYGFLIFDLIDGKIENLRRELIKKYNKFKLFVDYNNLHYVKKEIENNYTNLYKLSVIDEKLKKEFNYENVVGIDLLNKDFNEEETKNAIDKIRKQSNLDPYDIITGLLNMNDIPEDIKKDIELDIKNGLNNV